MSIALVVDAACDLPKSFLDKRGIVLFPITINVDGSPYIDDKDPKKLSSFYSKKLLTLDHDAESIPFSADEITELFMRDIVPNYDFALIQTVSKKRSQIHENSSVAQHQVLKEYREEKKSGNITNHFGMRVMNSATVFTGQAMLAAFTSDLIAAGKSKQDILRLAEAFKNKIHAYAVLPDVKYIRERARKRGEDSLSALSAIVAKSLDLKPIIKARNDETAAIAKFRGFDNSVEKLFEYAQARLKKGLLSPYIIVSIAGEETELLQHSAFGDLLNLAKAHKIEVITCVMGLTTGLNLGPGAISLALAAEEHEFE